MRHVFSRLGLLLVTLSGLTASLASLASPAISSARGQSGTLWEQPIDLTTGASLVEGSLNASLDANLVTKVQQGTAWEQTFPGWYARGDALFLTRTDTREKVLTVSDAGTFDILEDDIPLITTDDLTFDNFEAGWRTELGRSFGNGLAIEGNYWKIDSWDARAQITSNGILATSPIADALSPPDFPDFALFDVDDFYQALQHTYDYHSEIFSSEINVRATWRWHNFVRSQLAGIRFLQLRDSLLFVSQDDRLATPADGIGVYDIRTQNNLLGIQYGEELMMPLLGSATLTVNSKVGLYWNDIEQRSSIFNTGNFLVDTINTNEHLALVAELGAFTNVKITDMCSIRGGYNIVYLDGVALAPEQFTFAPFQQSVINEHGHLILHGFNLGLELRR
jgi:hypothetical protein